RRVPKIYFFSQVDHALPTTIMESSLLIINTFDESWIYACRNEAPLTVAGDRILPNTFKSLCQAPPWSPIGLSSAKQGGPIPMAQSVPSHERILQLGFGFWGSKALLSAVELGVFTELAKKPATLAELQSRLKLHPRSARDFLDTLVALGMLERDGQGTYRN